MGRYCLKCDVCILMKQHHMTSTHQAISYPCPRCQTPTLWIDNPTKPFCSERCKLIDLGAWASEQYRVPADDEPLSDELKEYQ